MFEKFGNFNSVEGLNRAARAQKEEGDEEALVLLALENGIDREDAEDYIDGCTEELATPLMAAMGKLKIEADNYRISGVLMDWADEVRNACTESEKMARAVRKQNKSLAKYIALLADAGFKNKSVVDKSIVKLCSDEIENIVGEHEFYIGIPDKTTRKNIMQEYYLDGESNDSI